MRKSRHFKAARGVPGQNQLDAARRKTKPPAVNLNPLAVANPTTPTAV